MDIIKLQTSTYILRVHPEELVCLHGDGNYTEMVLSNGYRKTLTLQLGKFYDILVTLRHTPFLRVGKSLVVNKDYVFYVEPGIQSLILSGQGLVEPLPLTASKEALRELKELLGKEK